MIRILLFLSIILCSTITYTASDVTFYTLENDKISWSSLKGKWVFIHYWASWCHICLEEIPTLNKFYKQNKDKVALFAVNYDGISLEEQRALAKQLNIQFPSLGEDPGFALGLEDMPGLPATFVFNPNQELADALYGAQSEQSLVAAQESSLKKPVTL